MIRGKSSDNIHEGWSTNLMFESSEQEIVLWTARPVDSGEDDGSDIFIPGSEESEDELAGLSLEHEHFLLGMADRLHNFLPT